MEICFLFLTIDWRSLANSHFYYGWLFKWNHFLKKWLFNKTNGYSQPFVIMIIKPFLYNLVAWLFNIKPFVQNGLFNKTVLG